MPAIVVVGSSNTDMVVNCPRIPRPGETLIGGDLAMLPGGKGANQAVAAARLGACVTLIACVGSDAFGDEALECFRREAIDTSHIIRDRDAPSGVALICVDDSGENSIAVAPGADSRLRPEHVRSARDAFESADMVLVQLEIPLETVKATLDLAAETGTRVILNPAPARALPAEMLAAVTLITPNEPEAALLGGYSPERIPGTEQLAMSLQTVGCRSIVLTLGARGSIIINSGDISHVPAFGVTAVDTTAAGDAFNGALAVALAEGKPLEDAARFASAAAAISVTRAGAQPSLPARPEVAKFFST